MEYEDQDGAKEAVELTRWPDSGTITAIAPGAPTGLTATANGTTQIDLSWTAPASDGGADITGYKIEISSDGGNAWTTHLADTSDANTTYAHTGLAGGTTRHYRVSAINTIGTSAASNIDDATTNAAPTVANAIPDQEATVDTAFNYAFPDTTFSDADSDALTYTATALPTWLMFAATTRTFSGIPQAANVGTVSVMVTASDGKGGSVSDTFDILVSAATNNAATGAPTITGTPTVGETLTAVTTAIMDDDGLTTPGYTYQWIRVATDSTETDIGLGDGEHLHAGDGRPGQDDQGEGELHRRRQQPRDADQRGDGGRRGGAEHRGDGRADDQRHAAGRADADGGSPPPSWTTTG